MDVPAVRTQSIAEKPAMFLTLPIGLYVFGLFDRRQTPSIGERLALNTTECEVTDNRHQQILLPHGFVEVRGDTRLESREPV